MASRPGPQGQQARGPEAARQSYALEHVPVRCSRVQSLRFLQVQRVRLAAIVGC